MVAVRMRRAVALGMSVAVPLALVLWGGHVGVHMARNLLFPGAGVVDHSPLLAAAFAVLAVAATVVWLQWGADWVVVAVVIASTAVAGLLAVSHPSLGTAQLLHPVRAAHEFPLVVLVIVAIAWVRSAAGRVPVLRHLVIRRNRALGGGVDLASLAPVDRCRAAALFLLLAPNPEITVDSAWSADVIARARRVSAVARLRFGRDPLGRDHAPLRTVRLLAGRMSEAERNRYASEALSSDIGAPCSEPSWVRPLDATLAVLALQRCAAREAGAKWVEALGGAYSLRRGHRPAWWWTPLGVGAGSAPAWEHAAFTGLARAAGWVEDADWHALRKRALGAAARGAEHPHDERLVAAARVWLAFVDDPEAMRIIHRPGVRRDPLACALDQLAALLCENPAALRPAAAGTPSGGDQS